MILKLSLNTRMIWMIFMKLFKDRQILIVFDDLIDNILSNEKLQQTVTKNNNIIRYKCF